MTDETATPRQLVDWSSALWAGVIAGALFLALNLVVTPAVLGGNGWVFIRLLASITLGQDVLAPPATFDAAALAAGGLTHLLLSIGYALLLALIVHRWGVIAAMVLGGLFGVALYGINVYTLTMLFPAFMTMQSWTFLLTHVIFGVAAGGLYEALEVERFEMVEPDASIPAAEGE